MHGNFLEIPKQISMYSSRILETSASQDSVNGIQLALNQTQGQQNLRKLYLSTDK
jgi:hypothetical protein